MTSKLSKEASYFNKEKKVNKYNYIYSNNELLKKDKNAQKSIKGYLKRKDFVGLRYYLEGYLGK